MPEHEGGYSPEPEPINRLQELQDAWAEEGGEVSDAVRRLRELAQDPDSAELGDQWRALSPEEKQEFIDYATSILAMITPENDFESDPVATAQTGLADVIPSLRHSLEATHEPQQTTPAAPAQEVLAAPPIPETHAAPELEGAAIIEWLHAQLPHLQELAKTYPLLEHLYQDIENLINAQQDIGVWLSWEVPPIYLIKDAFFVDDLNNFMWTQLDRNEDVFNYTLGVEQNYKKGQRWARQELAREYDLHAVFPAIGSEFNPNEYQKANFENLTDDASLNNKIKSVGIPGLKQGEKTIDKAYVEVWKYEKKG